ncbi:MAG: hypothetical protein HC886_01595 [Leptolyngbyaceae cyanobacterium SM1_1_3]|nr:hypothetical protein [Leptolyngbyaceae cyanobacterium SM1_1_3]NJN03287.1 hypothetical protein [Leptolyngbyaceae cyanobacterium RM1_1_2]NJO09532.1 hypothetical protein [Leptolyngbyaceae cyanobacterium SL_1_1]
MTVCSCQSNLLGFGSVWLEIDWDKTDLRLGTGWNKFYRSLTLETSTSAKATDCMEDYQKFAVAANGKGQRFDQIFFIAAFCHCSKGYKGYEDSAAVHYPRSARQATLEREAFKWFVENERGARLAF